MTVCLDQRGPEAAKSFPGRELVRARPDPAGARPAGRARQEVGDGRRGKGYIFGASQPADGEAFTRDSPRRAIAHGVDFLAPVEGGIPADIARVDALVDHLHAHRAMDVLLFSLAHPRGEFVFPPKSAASLNLIEPGWKILRALALKGRRFATWGELAPAVREATASWNQHRHPFLRGRRRRHQPRRCPGVGRLPKVA